MDLKTNIFFKRTLIFVPQKPYCTTLNGKNKTFLGQMEFLLIENFSMKRKVAWDFISLTSGWGEGNKCFTFL